MQSEKRALSSAVQLESQQQLKSHLLVKSHVQMLATEFMSCEEAPNRPSKMPKARILKRRRENCRIDNLL